MKEKKPTKKDYVIQPIFYIGSLSMNGGNINLADNNSIICENGIVSTKNNNSTAQINKCNSNDMIAQIVTLQYQVQCLQEQIKELCRILVPTIK